MLANPVSRNTFDWGTSQNFVAAEKAGWLPVKNYTTNLFPEADRFMGEEYRPHRGDGRPLLGMPHQAPPHGHGQGGPVRRLQGRGAGVRAVGGLGAADRQHRRAGALVLSNEVDRLGMDTNEAGWVIGWAIECFEKGILTSEDTGGLEMNWGNVEAARAMLRKIAYREGIGDLLAEGVKRASEKLGRGSEELAVYTRRATRLAATTTGRRWIEMLDTCVSDTGTIAVGPAVKPEEQGAPAKMGAFDPEEIAETLGKHTGRMVFEDCLGTCRFTTPARSARSRRRWPGHRLGGLRRGGGVAGGPADDQPAAGLQPAARADPRTGVPLQALRLHPGGRPGRRQAIDPHWDEMRAGYYRLMGWDLETGRPLPETLAALDLPEVSKRLWA